MRQALTDCRLSRVVLGPSGRLSLMWDSGLGEDANEIYRGTIRAPFAYGHDDALACALPAQTEDWTTPDDQVAGQPSYYYLVVPRRGSQRLYGSSSSGAARPPSASECP